MSLISAPPLRAVHESPMPDSQQLPLSPDAELVELARRGDVQAYGALVERFELAAFGVVRALIRDRHAAEDITQEVFIQAYLKLGWLRDPSRFPYWLMKIARHQAIRALRKRRRTAVPVSADIEAPAAPQDCVLDDEKRVLLRHVQRLPAHEQIVVALRFFQGYTLRQIAEVGHSSVGTVSKRLSRALARLRKSLAAGERS